jgi:cytochrome c peroxidase
MHHSSRLWYLPLFLYIFIIGSLLAEDETRPPRRVLSYLSRHPVAYGTEAIPDELLLGDMLFHSSGILGPKAQSLNFSCNTCHTNGVINRNFFLEGLSSHAGTVDVTTRFFGGRTENNFFDPRDIPSLRGIRFTLPYGRQALFGSLREFTRHVIVREFAGTEPPENYLDALVRYQQEFDFLANQYLDNFGRLKQSLVSEKSLRGEKVFKNAGCVYCHIPTSYFTDGRVHRIGSGTTSSPWSLENGFKTPTLLGVLETAPYFHDGSLKTLAEVIEWFDEHQQLHLSNEDKSDLLDYLCLIGSGEKPNDDSSPQQQLLEATQYLDLLRENFDLDLWRLTIPTVQSRFAEIGATTHDQDGKDLFAYWRSSLEHISEAYRSRHLVIARKQLEEFIEKFQKEIRAPHKF